MSTLGEHQGNGIRFDMHLSAPNGGVAQMLCRPEGQWVSWSEYDKLKAEVEAHEKRWAESEDLISHYKQQRDEAINDCECSRLKAEVERLISVSEAWKKRRLDKVEDECIKWSDYEKLKAENKRLRKAGDAMAEAMWYGDAERSIWVKKFAETEWNAAKEGKQP